MTVVLAVNGGSSSLKLGLFRFQAQTVTQLARASASGMGTPHWKWKLKLGDGDSVIARDISDPGAALTEGLDALVEAGAPSPEVVGHRLVHGGPAHQQPLLVTPELTSELTQVIPFAPLHLPAELRALEQTTARYPGVPQVVCFDTGFHSTMPDVATRLPLPHVVTEAGLRRYGFHGLSYEFVISQLCPGDRERTIIAHLGSGSSMVAVRGSRSLDTTMGLTPAGGFMMGTRPGDLDPGVLLRLLAEGWTRDRLESLIEAESGLLGVSGLSSDMKTLLAARDTHAGARLAVEMYVSQIAKSVGALTTVLGGVDTLVFTGGIGENAPVLRSEVCARLSHLGLSLDETRNHAAQSVISSGPGAIRIVPTDEELVIARHAVRLFEETSPR